MIMKGQTTSFSMQSIFDDIFPKILIIVASCSLKDLFSAKMFLVRVQCDLGVPWVGFQARRAQSSLFSQLSQLGTIECNGMPREVLPMFI
ncbi:hypothetical protein DVH24_015775 [Malus domestica]|uniref:Uncharacterized protein n=1 Tax=Malus domestica TaxID=3750 RepID=A0A498HQM5_MALDO|nr:hypothetical protein DVH24_015775 [Malus domestica]